MIVVADPAGPKQTDEGLDQRHETFERNREADCVKATFSLDSIIRVERHCTSSNSSPEPPEGNLIMLSAVA